jgi:hypothetical protein
MIKVFFSLGLIFFTGISHGASYETLPEGISMFVIKHVETSKIESKYNNQHQNNSLSLKENFTSQKLENINSAIKTYFAELKSISPDAYSKFSLGEFTAKADAQIKVQGLGIARGMTDRLTLYGSLPFYHIKSNVSFNQTKRSNLAAVTAAVENVPTSSALSAFVKQLTTQLPETNEALLQSLVVNYYGYHPLGKWEKEALGDAEIGMLYRLTDFKESGAAIAVGATLPTGDNDDPDSLQDVPTGDGQYDAFIEPAAGISFFDNSIAFDLKTRLTYQFSSRKTFRTTLDPDIPLTKVKESMIEKLGNKIDATASMTYNATSWLNINASYLYSETGPSKYNAADLKIKKILERNTLSSNHWQRIGMGVSTLELYKKKKVDIPFEVNLTAQKLVNAKNTANYNRYDFDFRFYF